MGQEIFRIKSFTVTPSFSGSPDQVTFTLTDAEDLLTTSKMKRSVIGQAIDEWLETNAAQLVINGVTLRGSDGHPGTGDGFNDFNWKFFNKVAETANSVVTTSLTVDPIVVSKPFADVA